MSTRRTDRLSIFVRLDDRTLVLSLDAARQLRDAVIEAISAVAEEGRPCKCCGTLCQVLLPDYDLGKSGFCSLRCRNHRQFNGNARLTLEQVREIRSSPEPGVVLARRLGVSPTAISRIRSGERWSEEQP